MYCARHPKVETKLTCGKCNQPICPKCLVQTPVGARCPDCAKLSRLPMFQVSLLDYLKVVGIGLGLALAAGVIWRVVVGQSSFAFILVLMAVAYGIGELGSRSVNRKRSTALQVITGISVALCYVLAIGLQLSVFGLIGLIAGISIAANRFRFR